MSLNKLSLAGKSLTFFTVYRSRIRIIPIQFFELDSSQSTFRNFICSGFCFSFRFSPIRGRRNTHTKFVLARLSHSKLIIYDSKNLSVYAFMTPQVETLPTKNLPGMVLLAPDSQNPRGQAFNLPGFPLQLVLIWEFSYVCHDQQGKSTVQLTCESSSSLSSGSSPPMLVMASSASL
jgi:hypothetical protein